MTKYECSFCGKKSGEVKKLVVGYKDIYGQHPAICDLCLQVCYDMPDVVVADA